MTNYEFMQAAEKKVAQCWATLMQRYNKVYPSPKLEFTLRGTTAGVHFSRTGIINLNLGFVAKNAEDMLEQTVPHEVVHAWLTVSGHPSHVRSASSMMYVDQFSIRRRRSRRSPRAPRRSRAGRGGSDRQRRYRRRARRRCRWRLPKPCRSALNSPKIRECQFCHSYEPSCTERP